MPRFPVLLLFVPCLLCGPAISGAQEARVLFEKQCAVCHRPGGNRAPLPEALAKMPVARIVAALETGPMKQQGAALTHAERVAVAEFLNTDREPAAKAGAAASNTCTSAPPLSAGFQGWNGWGVDLANTRFQPGSTAGLTAGQVKRLKVKWAFGFAGTPIVYGQPSIAGQRLYFGSLNGTVYSLDARSGCVYWTFKADATVRSAISLAEAGSGHLAAFFGDTKAQAYAVDANTGALLWKSKVEDHPVARITGAPKVYGGRLYMPVSSIEEVNPANPKYVCCSFRGSVVALDAATGKQIWKTYSIPDPPGPNGKSAAGTDRLGPAGAAIWSSPTIDVQRKVLYVGTGNQYSDPVSRYTDAVLALDLETGSMKWSKQMTAGDGWNFACLNPNKGSCPETAGPDVDIGSSPILRSAGGRDLLMVGQKSGVVHALDPDHAGEIVWQVRVGKGGSLGGIMWGSAADTANVYVPLSDWAAGKAGEVSTSGGGLFALKIATGEKSWYTPPATPACAAKPGCSPSQMAPATAIPGVVFSGSMDGHLRAYSAEDGSVIWDLDTLHDFETVNGVPAHGGSLNATGPTIANGMVFANSGYGALGGMPGNVLLALSVDGK